MKLQQILVGSVSAKFVTEVLEDLTEMTTHFALVNGPGRVFLNEDLTQAINEFQVIRFSMI